MTFQAYIDAVQSKTGKAPEQFKAQAANNDALSQYKAAKGSVQLPLDQPMPLKLIRQLAIFRVKESKARARK